MDSQQKKEAAAGRRRVRWVRKKFAEPYHIYDAVYKKIFSHKEVVAALLEDFGDKDIVGGMDLGSLQTYQTEHITRSRKSLHNDLIWKVKYGSGTAYVLIMLEFQHTESWRMALRILSYACELLGDFVAEEKPGRRELLPPVLPFVLYNGKVEWKAPTEVSKLFHGHDGPLSRFLPHFSFRLLDIRHLAAEVEGKLDFARAVLRFENYNDIDDLVDILRKLARLLPARDREALQEAFLDLLRLCCGEDSEIGQKIVYCKTIKEAVSMFDENMPRWKAALLKEGWQEGREEGRQEGIKDGMRNALVALLVRKFGALPETVLKYIDGIKSCERLQNLVVAGVGAQSLQEFSALLDAENP